MFRVTHASDEELETILGNARRAQLTYEAVGATNGVELPAGYQHDRHQRLLGSSISFERAREGLRRWQTHVGAGVEVYPTDDVTDGRSVLVVVQLGPLQVVAPCRIVYVIDETDRFGFGYGTLPGHPESGEESFVVERDSESTVFKIVAFSRPADVVTRLAGPITRGVQRHFTRRYLAALATYIGWGASDRW